MTIFGPAIEEIKLSGKSYKNPEEFVPYLKRNDLRPNKKTAAAISVDSLSRLDLELKEAGLMVFRLGSGGGRHTKFALVKKERNDWSDYFLLDESIFGLIPPVLFIPNANYQTLFGFRLLPKLTETSLVSFSIHSGLLGHAIDLDQDGIPLAPATGQSTFTFMFKPLSSLDVAWEHGNGQVEIDAIFAGRRKNKHIAVIVESKASTSFSSLAKHKLLYPYLALRKQVPSYMDVILIYMRAIKEADGFHFYICECDSTPLQNDVTAIDSLRPKNAHHLVVQL
jgi:hypothetical protein